MSLWGRREHRKRTNEVLSFCEYPLYNYSKITQNFPENLTLSECENILCTFSDFHNSSYYCQKTIMMQMITLFIYYYWVNVNIFILPFFWFSQDILCKLFAQALFIYFHKLLAITKINYLNYFLKHCNLKLLLSECEKFVLLNFHNTKKTKLCKFICSSIVISKFSLI